MMKLVIGNRRYSSQVARARFGEGGPFLFGSFRAPMPNPGVSNALKSRKARPHDDR
jgi:hypothetical protein